MDSNVTNLGAVRMKVKLRGRGAKAAFARQRAVVLSLVSHWLAGDQKPNSVHRAGIEDELGISFRDFDVTLTASQAAEEEARLLAAETEAEAEPEPTFPVGDPDSPAGGPRAA